MPFKHNAWYVGALSSELRVGAMISRLMLTETVLLTRLSNGEVAAMGGVCPHRFAPLVRGNLVGDRVQCGYHGLEFAASTGLCVRNPRGSGIIDERLRVKSYQTLELHGFVWVWLGTSEPPEPSAIPDFSSLQRSPAHMTVEGYLHSNSNYQVITDNLLDASHGDFVHPGLLTSYGAFCQPPKMLVDGDTVAAQFIIENGPAQPFFALYLPRPNEPADQEHVFKWYPPAMVWIESRLTQAGREASPLTSQNLHVLTPATENSTHYWFRGVRNFADLGPDGALRVSEELMKAFSEEDKPMLEAVSQAMGGRDFWELRPAILEGDNVSVMARKKLRKMIANELGK